MEDDPTNTQPGTSDKGKKKGTFSILRKWYVGGVLTMILGGFVGAAISLPIGDWWEARKSQPFIAVVLSDDDDNFTIPEELEQGIQEQMKQMGADIKTSGQKLVGIEFLKSPPNEEEIQQTIKSDCLDVRECIAIVGNSDSTTTAITLNTILRYDGVKPALIMPIATANSITERAARADYPQILRLVPSNRNQALEIKSFIANRAPNQRVTIIIDPNNPGYSKNLSEQLIRMIDENGGVAKSLEYKDSSTLDAANRRGLGEDDFLVFVGTSTNGLEVIKDMKRLGIEVPIIFTDGNTVQDVIARSEGMHGEAFFLTPVAELNDLNEPGYTAIGRDTYELLAAIVQRSSNLTRASISEFVADRKYDIALQTGDAGSYRFDQSGENTAMRFRIFSIVDGKPVIQIGY